MSEYFSNKEYISNSQLGYLLMSPRRFKEILENPESSDEMEFGSLFHCYVLEPSRFKEDIIVFDGKKPVNEQQLRFCKLLQDISKEDAYEQCYSIKNKSKEKIKYESEQLYKSLFEYAEVCKSGKQMISSEDYNRIIAMTASIQDHKMAQKLLHGCDETYVEYPIYWEIMGVKVKSKIDKLNIDRENNTATIIDLKSTDKLYTFPSSFRKYHVARQLGCYSLAITFKANDLGLTNPNIQWKIIATESSDLYETKVINIPEEIVQEGVNEFVYLIEKYKLHLQYGFDYNIDYYLGSGEEELILTI